MSLFSKLFGPPPRGLFEAIEAGDLRALRKAVKRGGDLEQRNANGNTPLLALFAVGHFASYLELQQRILSAPNEAGIENHYEMARVLLQAGANVNAQNAESGMTVLHWLCSQSALSDPVFLHLILMAPVDLELKDKNGNIALFYAARDGATHFVELLMVKGAKPDKRTQRLMDRERARQESIDHLDPMGDLRVEAASVEDADEFDLPSKALANIHMALEKTNVDLGAINIGDHQLAVLTVSKLGAEINNGGFDQYFFNSGGDDALRAQAGLALIGWPEMRALLDQALAVFPAPYPVDRKTRWAIMEEIEPRAKPIWNELDKQFYAMGRSHHDVLRDFIKANWSHFVREA